MVLGTIVVIVVGADEVVVKVLIVVEVNVDGIVDVDLVDADVGVDGVPVGLVGFSVDILLYLSISC